MAEGLSALAPTLHVWAQADQELGSVLAPWQIGVGPATTFGAEAEPRNYECDFDAVC